MTVRQFTEADRQVLRQVYLDTRRQTFAWLDASSFSLADFDADTEGERIWVGEESGAVVGFVSVWEAGNFIHNLFVLPQFAGRGHGSRLLNVCLQSIGRPAQLKCAIHNSSAIAFYYSRGWQYVSKGRSTQGDYYLLEFPLEYLSE